MDGRVVDQVAEEARPGMTPPDDDTLTAIRKRISGGYAWWRENHDNATTDLDFIYGDQWPAAEKEKRAKEDRPALNFNILPQFVNQVTNAMRQSQFSIRVLQTAGLNDPVPVFGGQQRISPSELMEGIIRNIEARSQARHEYNEVFQHEVETGWGWLKLRIIRTPEDPFSKEIRIEHLPDRWSAIMDPQAKRGNFSDARWGCDYVTMDRDDFMERYPEASTTANITLGADYSEDYRRYWGEEDTVRVADYYWRESVKKTFVECVHQETFERHVFLEEDVKRVLDDLEDLGYVVKRKKEFDSTVVKRMRLTATDVLEGPDEWPSMYIPLIPVVGRKIRSRDYAYYVGLARFAHDPVKMLNYWNSSLTERIAMSPKAPYIAAEEQIAGHEEDWNNMHKSNKPVLLYKHVDDLPPPSRIGPAVMPAAEMQGAMLARAHVGDAIGMHDANVGRTTNEVSGKAINEREEKGHVSTFDYVSNLAYSLGHVGTVLVDMIPKVYSNQTAMRLIGEDGTEMQVAVNLPVVDKESGKTFHVADLALGRYTCVADVGPSSSTQRQTLLQTMQEVGRSMPQFFMGIADLFVQALDVPMRNVLSKRLKKMVPRHLLSEKEQQELPPPQPTPEQMVQMEELKTRQLEASSKAEIAKAKVDEAGLDVQRMAARVEEQTERSSVNQDLEVERQAEKLAKKDQQQQPPPVTLEDVQRLVKEGIAEAMANR